MSFLKWFGWGILWAMLLPFLLIAIALIAVFGIPVFLFELMMTIVHFFKGESCFPMYEEDKKAMEILQRSLDAQRAKEAGIAGQTQSQPQTVYVQQNYYVQNPPTPNGALPNGNPQLPPHLSSQPPYLGQTGQPPLSIEAKEVPAEEVEEEVLTAPVAPKKPTLMEFPQSDDSEGGEQ